MGGIASIGLLVINTVCAQAGETTPKFGIADVHARAPNSILAMRTGFSRGRYELHNATMVDLIRTAWSVQPDNVIGGPEWMEIDRFDVVATAPAASTPDTLRAMLRGLLAERFGLVARRDSRDLPAYVLTAGRKLRLEQADGSGDTGCRLQGKNPPPRAVAGAPVVFACRNMTIAAFANGIARMPGAPGYLFNYRVVDRTGLTGAWNFDLRWSQRAAGRGGPPGDSITIFDAIEKQLGLKLAMSKVPTPVVVVERVNEKPTGNLPEVAEKLPSPSMEFEVAEIKPADPDDPIKGSSVGIKRGGLVNIHMTMKGLIQEAWNDLNPDRILGGPKSLDTTRFVVVAKAPDTNLASDGAVFSGIDIDSMRMMLRALLVERFKLVAHEEDRLVAGYALVAGRPKLRKAEPSNRPGCREGPGADGKDPRIANPVASRLVTCRNMTMAQFAGTLRETAGRYLYRFPPVVDLTGIAGRYDFTINFSEPGATQNTPIDAAVASEPDGSVTLFEAMERQLGLKLEARKVTAPVLVIDHVNELPAEN